MLCYGSWPKNFTGYESEFHNNSAEEQDNEKSSSHTFGCLGMDEVSCQQTGDECLWSAEHGICYMKRNGRGGKGKPEREDACAALDKARCKVRSFAGNCSWSTEKMLCYGSWPKNFTGYESEFHNNSTEEQDNEKSSSHAFGCLGMDEASCQQTGDECLWSAEHKICYMKRNGRGGKGKHERQDACAALDEARCKVQPFAESCSWSTEKMLCYGSWRGNFTGYETELHNNSTEQQDKEKS